MNGMENRGSLTLRLYQGIMDRTPPAGQRWANAIRRHSRTPVSINSSQPPAQRALDYLNTRERLYCFDGFAGRDSRYRIKVRVSCSRPCHALFMHTMLIRPTKDGIVKSGLAADAPER